MLQFVLVMIHAFQLLFIECNYPKAFAWWIGMHAVMFYFLFRKFYIKSYKQKKSDVAIGKQELKNESDKRKQQQQQQQKVQRVRDDCKEPINANENNAIYANQYKMATGYISDSGLRNRVFIDSRAFDE